eukprot:CAMPEP_0179228902 /NCGR_PEP_ID=MMETSP0797-20121207/10060_1 /TAXON_ID=47934 /ORGANISM="Dinophysis acuminata, Strain DAEP01" /LENGTH=595 /DNA_ID=CAMNT_0020935959 /DNA_START=11 /DNA_END=1798 /DNA_ORIENTATION=-
MAEEQSRTIAYEPVTAPEDDASGVATTLRRWSRARKLQLVGVLAVVLVVAVALAAATPARPLRQGKVAAAQQDWSLWGALFGGGDEAASETTSEAPATGDGAEEDDGDEDGDAEDEGGEEDEEDEEGEEGEGEDEDSDDEQEETTKKKTTATTKKTTTTRPRATAPPTTRAPAADANPFSKKTFYDRPTHKKAYDYAIKYTSGGTKDNLKKMRNVPSAFWVSNKANIKPFEALLKDAAAKSPPELVVMIWYDLPNRDCASKASTGEICCNKNEDGTCDYDDQDNCSDGIREYKSTYVDPLVSVLQEYTLEKDVPVVVVLEPDSLPNLATNAANPHCGKATAEGYKTGIKYALDELTSKTGAAVYIDAANGGWLGWEKNMVGFMKIIKGMDLPLEKIRGFTTNVAKYQPLGVMCPWESHDSGTYQNGHCLAEQHADDPCCKDPCHLLGQYSPANNELNYVQKLVRAADGILGMEAHVVIDTSRNGWEGMDRDEKCANWCNLRGAGAGHVPTTSTAKPEMIDAYFWLKTPGESDGCTEELPNGDKCKRFDEECKSENSIGTKKGEPRVDEAGLWDEFQVKELAANAHLGDHVAVSVL